MYFNLITRNFTENYFLYYLQSSTRQSPLETLSPTGLISNTCDILTFNSNHVQDSECKIQDITKPFYIHTATNCNPDNIRFDVRSICYIIADPKKLDNFYGCNNINLDHEASESDFKIYIMLHPCVGTLKTDIEWIKFFTKLPKNCVYVHTTLSIFIKEHNPFTTRQQGNHYFLIGYFASKNILECNYIPQNISTYISVQPINFYNTGHIVNSFKNINYWLYAPNITP